MITGPSFVNFSNERSLVTIEHFGVLDKMGANALYKFHSSPEYAVNATGLENADKDQPSYVIRGVLPDGVFQMIYAPFYTSDRGVFWIEKGRDRVIDLKSKEACQALDKKLRPLELDLEMAMKFLLGTPNLKKDLQRERGYD